MLKKNVLFLQLHSKFVTALWDGLWVKKNQYKKHSDEKKIKIGRSEM